MNGIGPSQEMHFDVADAAFVKLVAVKRSIDIFAQLGWQEQPCNSKNHGNNQHDNSHRAPHMSLLPDRPRHSAGTLRASVGCRSWMVVLFHLGSPFANHPAILFTLKAMLHPTKTQWGEWLLKRVLEQAESLRFGLGFRAGDCFASMTRSS